VRGRLLELVRGDDAGSPTPPSDAGSGDAGDGCQACADTAQASGGQCASEVNACMNSQKCTTLANCLNNCAASDTTCQNTCASAAGTTATNDYEAIGNCICMTACSSQCTSECM